MGIPDLRLWRSKGRTQALVNGGDNYNRPMVGSAAIVKFGYMLENLLNLRLLWYNMSIEGQLCQVKKQSMQTTSRKD